MIKLSGTFIAKSDDGTQYTIYKYTEYLDAGSGEFIESWKDLRLSSGTSVNRIKQGEYQIVDTGIILYSNASDAP